MKVFPSEKASPTKPDGLKFSAIWRQFRIPFDGLRGLFPNSLGHALTLLC
jgi:hypothetical protein